MSRKFWITAAHGTQRLTGTLVGKDEFRWNHVRGSLPCRCGGFGYTSNGCVHGPELNGNSGCQAINLLFHNDPENLIRREGGFLR